MLKQGTGPEDPTMIATYSPTARKGLYEYAMYPNGVKPKKALVSTGESRVKFSAPRDTSVPSDLEQEISKEYAAARQAEMAKGKGESLLDSTQSNLNASLRSSLKQSVTLVALDGCKAQFDPENAELVSSITHAFNEKHGPRKGVSPPRIAAKGASAPVPTVTAYELRKHQQRQDSLRMGAAALHKKKKLQRSPHYPPERDHTLFLPSNDGNPMEDSSSPLASPRRCDAGSSSDAVVPLPAVNSVKRKAMRPPPTALEAWKMSVGLLDADRNERQYGEE